MSYIRRAPRPWALIVLTASVWAVACSNANPTAPAGSNITLGIGDHVSIARTPLVITFTRLAEDSRCAPDVVCIWHGNAQVELDARIGTEHTPVLLNTHVGAREAVVDTYRITLSDFTPPPASTVSVTPEYYRATIIVRDTRGVACTEEARPALSVAVTDSLLGPVLFTDVSIVASDGEYRDSVFQATYPGAPFNGPVSFAYERSGTYEVTVRAAGYAPWIRGGVVVERDACHVITVPLTARLVR